MEPVFDHKFFATLLAIAPFAVGFIVWLIRLEGRVNNIASVIEERSNKNTMRAENMQKQIDEVRARQEEHGNDVKESLSTLVRQVGRLEGMIEVLVDKSKER